MAAIRELFSFMNPAFQSLFANMTPRAMRGRILSSIGGGGIWLMRGAWGSGILGMTMQTLGTLLSGYIYKYDNSLPWTHSRRGVVFYLCPVHTAG